MNTKINRNTLVNFELNSQQIEIRRKISPNIKLIRSQFNSKVIFGIETFEISFYKNSVCEEKFKRYNLLILTLPPCKFKSIKIKHGVDNLKTIHKTIKRLNNDKDYFEKFLIL